jgi:hypothetical protein
LLEIVHTQLPKNRGLVNTLLPLHPPKGRAFIH